MIPFRSSSLLSAFFACVLSLSIGRAEFWIDDPKEARRVAEEEGRPLVVFFSGSDWCALCRSLEKGLFADSEVRKLLSEQYVPLHLDYPRKKKLPLAVRREREKWRVKYKVGAYPTILFLDPKSEKELFRHQYVKLEPKDYIDIVLAQVLLLDQETDSTPSQQTP